MKQLKKTLFTLLFVCLLMGMTACGTDYRVDDDGNDDGVLEDVGRGIDDGVRDVTEGVEDGIEDITGDDRERIDQRIDEDTNRANHATDSDDIHAHENKTKKE